MIAAYGTRATEIARKAASSKAVDASNWIFSAYAGVDATSLWAAATSKKAALPVHLLACMLARAWDDGEATSLWVELVAERRKEVSAKLEAGEELPYAHMSAAYQADISREQLAKWDASARAWLRTADDIMDLQYKQLLLIIKNISLPVNEETITYRSIISAWTSALTTIEKVIRGGPHVVRNGAVLLALSSWHLYANMIVVGSPNGTTEVAMSDPLVSPAGILTLGVSDSGARAREGVYWSLSLAHHKFYGRPVAKTGHVDGMATRMTFLELQQAIIGAILSHWRIPAEDTVEALRFLLQLGRHMLRDCCPADLGHRWIESLTVPITEYFKDEVRSAAAVSLGRRRSVLVPAKKDGNPDKQLFGLQDEPTLLRIIPDTRGRIEFLKRLASAVPELRGCEPVIAYLDQEKWHFEPVFPTDSATSQPRRSKRATRQAETSTPKFERHRTLLTRIHDRKQFVFLFGDADAAALFVLDQTESSPWAAPTPRPTFRYSDLCWLMDHDLLPPEALRKAIFDIQSPVVLVLFRVAMAARMYSGLAEDGATVSSRVLSSPFEPHALRLPYDSESRYDSHRLQRPNQARTGTISLIAYLETGQDLLGGPNHDKCVRLLGACIGDSIYVPRNVQTARVTKPFGVNVC